nr:VWA domain-containing protein [Oceanococcus sp. HetDA_MAG_MS8]
MFSRRGKTTHGGFYESFSDVIFATMAIFILLMTVFMVVIKTGQALPKTPIVSSTPQEPTLANQQAELLRERFEQELILQSRQQAAAARRDELQALVSGLQEQLQVTQAEIEAEQVSAIDAQRSINTVTIKERIVEIVVVIDASNSMRDEIRELRQVVGRMAQLFPYVTKEFRIGIIAHAHARNASRMERFALSTIRRTSDDGGVSYRRVADWLSAIRPRGGASRVLEASELAVGMFGRPQANHHQIVMVIGDVGPTEMDLGGAMHPFATQRMSRMQQVLTRFASSHQDRKLIMHFSGLDNLRGYDALKYRQARRLFKDIANISGQSGTYSENPTTMFVDFLVASLEQKS